MARVSAFFALLLLIFPIAYGANINVGGSNGWTRSFDYDAWAKTQTYTTNDVLVFTYGPSHAVSEVSKDDYDSCNTNNRPISSNAVSPTSVPLTAGGTRYFICPTVGHCPGGMKLAVTVTTGGTPPPAGTTPSPPSGTTPSPPSGTTPSPPVAGTIPAPPPPSAATIVLAGWNSLFVGLLIVVATLFAVVG